MTATLTPTRVRLPHLFRPRGYQLPFLRAFPHKQRRAAWIVRRRAGKDLTAWSAVMIPEAAETPGTYYYCLPTFQQARRVIWNGMDNDGIPLLARIPAELIAGEPNQSEMSVRLINGSIIQLIGSDNYDSIVGTNPRGLVFSEWALCDPRAWQYLQPIVAANGGWALFLYTPRGHNHGWDLLNTARAFPAEWFSEVLTIDDTGEMVPGELDEARASGMSEDLIRQEYYCDFEVGNEGSYYGRLMAEARKDGRVGHVPHDPARLVFPVFDIGVRDDTALGLVQVNRATGAVNAIDYYANNGEGAGHYAEWLEQRGRERHYRYPRDDRGNIRGIGPHDIGQRSKNDAKTYQEYARSAGLILTALPVSSVNAGIEAVRTLIPRMSWDATNCAHWVKALEAYQRKWNEVLHVWGDGPLHNWASNPADMTRYLAQAEKAGLLRDEQPAWNRPARTEDAPWIVKQPQGWHR
jgi:phage terminase large subunit